MMQELCEERKILSGILDGETSMCSRYALIDVSLLGKELFPAQTTSPKPDLDVIPRYNIAPSTFVAVTRIENGQQITENMMWGFPSPKGDRVINARIETIKERKMFSACFKRQRGIMTGNCFYEWKREGNKKKQPFKFFNKSGEPLYFACIWRDSVGEAGARIKVCCMCTSEPNSLVAPIHNRMALVLTKPLIDDWLRSGELNGPDYEKYKKPYPASLLECEPLDTYVNNVNHEGPLCWSPPKAEETMLF